ncbi:hypothetical protein T439DRAFT_322000 [Meredithblackwellia eburnea MCA 4105]
MDMWDFVDPDEASSAPQSPSPASASASASDNATAPLEPFPLLQLPPELVINIVNLADSRKDWDDWPSGVSSHFLALSETNSFFRDLARPRIWHSLHYQSLRRDRVRPSEYRRRRGLRALAAIIDEAEQRGEQLPLRLLSVTHPAGDSTLSEEDADAEKSAFVHLVKKLLQGGLKVLWLKSVVLHGREGDELIESIARAPELTALRLNQVSAGNKQLFKDLPTMSKLKTLQVMHGEKSLVNFVKLSLNLECILLWPSNRQFGKLMPFIIDQLGTLRFLSLDAVNEPSCFHSITEELKRRSEANEPIVLEEIFLEGHLLSRDRTFLIESLSAAPLKRLALYHVRIVTPLLIAQIADSIPGLEGLTLVQGDTSHAVRWHTPLNEYVDELVKLKNLKHFAYDRRSVVAPNVPNLAEAIEFVEDQKNLEFKALSTIGQACQSLRTAVAITLDVSQGAMGYFATFSQREGKRVHVDLKKMTVQDFLISFSRWCVM